MVRCLVTAQIYFKIASKKNKSHKFYPFVPDSFRKFYKNSLTRSSFLRRRKVRAADTERVHHFAAVRQPTSCIGFFAFFSTLRFR